MSIFNKILNKVSIPKSTKTKIPERDMGSFRTKVIDMAKQKRRTTKADGSNAQTVAYGKAMDSAQKNTKVFGVPGK